MLGKLGLYDEEIALRLRSIALDLSVEGIERRQRIVCEEDCVERMQGVVARCAGDRPLREMLPGFQDFLDDDGEAWSDTFLQTRQVLRRIGEAVDVVDTQAVNVPLLDEIEDQPMRRFEDALIFDPHAGQGCDVEESPVVDLLVGRRPVDEAP